MSNPFVSIEELWRSGRRRDAVQSLSTHVAEHPDDDSGWSLLGRYQLELGQNLEAVAALSQSVELKPSYPAAYNAGNALLSLGRLEEALSMFNVSTECFDGYPQAWVNRGIVLHQLSRTPEAVTSFNRALELDGEFLPGLRCKAIALEALGEKVESEELYAQMVALRPGDITVLAEYGLALSRLPMDNCMDLDPHGRSWRAIETLNAVLDKTPDDERALRAKAEVLYRNMHANVSFRTWGPDGFTYVAGPLRSGTFRGDLATLLEDATRRFPNDPVFREYMAELNDDASP